MLGHALSIFRDSLPLSGFRSGWELLLIGGIYLVERRGRKHTMNPRRQVDLTTVLESIPEAAFVLDGEQRVIDANSNAAQLLGRPREQLLDGHWNELTSALQSGNDAREHPCVLDRALRGAAVRSERRKVCLADGREIELVISATPMRDEQGAVVAALLIARDITELSMLQRRIGDAERHLAIGQMAAALAHDLNNILTAIGQAAYILEHGRGQSDKERRSYIGVIQNAVHRGAEIVARVRDYLRTGSGVLEPVNVCQLLREALELTRPLFERSNIAVRTDLADVPRTIGNAADLRRVFTNIIINAIEAMPHGGHLTASCSREGDRVVATVSDTGPGIAPENRRKVFYPYFTTKRAGTGLGLSGAQKMLRAQGGNITFRTESGKGTTFIVTLPTANEQHGPSPSSRRNLPAA